MSHPDCPVRRRLRAGLRSRFAWIATYLWIVAAILTCLPCRVAPAQVPIVPEAITTTDLQPIIETLGLSDQQALTLLPIHDAYKERYRSFLNTDVKDMTDKLVEIGLRFSRGRIEIPPRNELEAIVTEFKRLLERSRSLDRGFFTEIGGILAEEQMPKLERARINRELTIYRQILGGVGEMNRGAGVNLAEMTRGLDLSPQEREAVEPVLSQYESSLLAKSNDIYNILSDIAKVVLDFIDEIGIRNMTIEQMMAMAQNPPPDMLTRAQNIFDEASKPIQVGAYEVSQLNMRTYRNLVPLLSADNARDLRDRYFRRAYREIYQGDSSWERRYRRALRLEQLTEEQKAAITEQQAALITMYDAAVDSGVSALEDSRKYKTFRQFSQQDADPATEKVDDTIARRKTIEEQANNTLNALLGETLVAVLDEETKNDPDTPEGQRRSRVRAQARARDGGGDGGGGEVSVGVEVAAANEAIVQFEGALETEESRFLPAPLNAPQFEKVLTEIGLAGDDRAPAMTMFDSYRTEYDKLRADPLKVQKEGEEATPTETGKARTTRHEELIALDQRLFDDIALLLADDSAKATLQTLRQARMRDASTAVSKMLAQSFGNDEAYIDMVVLIIGSEMPADDRKRAAAALADYDARIAGQVQKRLDDSRDVRRRTESMERAGRRRAGAGGGPGAGGAGGGNQAQEFAMEKWRESRAALSTTNDKITAVNREMLEQLVGALPAEAAWQVRLAYNQAAYPEIFREGADKMIEGALSIPDLDDTQRERIGDLSAQYRADFFAICDQMVGLRKQRDFDVLGGQMPEKADIDREIELEKLRWNRNEIINRVRLKLALILNDDQAKVLPELHSGRR